MRVPQHDSLLVAIYSPTANTVTIAGNSRSRQLQMRAGTFEVVLLNDSAAPLASVASESFAKSNKTFQVDAQQPIVVYCFISTGYGTEAFTPIPVDRWGMEYYAAAMPGEVMYNESVGGATTYGKVPKGAPAEILVIAAFDGTIVTITPNGRLNQSVPAAVTLKKGECYQVQSYVDTSSFNLGTPQPDLGGSYISSNKPIGVISGNTRSQVIDAGGLAKNSFKNLMIEWLAPVEQHGREFVYLPTYDQLRPTGAPGEKAEDKRSGEVIRVYGTAGDANETTPTVTSGQVIEGTSGTIIQTLQIQRTKFFETLIGVPVAHVFQTDKPAQAFMNTTAVVKYNGTVGGGSAYDSWATYMVEMTPREQWPSVAPYYVPQILNTTEHYLNIVTDSASRNRITINGKQLAITRAIVGTPYYWISQKLTQGDRGVIAGADSSARFYAFIYGNVMGTEAFTVGTSNLNPGLYTESIGHMYGYPLAPRRRVLRPADSLLIDTSSDCGRLTIKIRTLNQKPSGLSSIRLDSANNAEVIFTDPTSPETVIGLTKAELTVRQIDPTKGASGSLVIEDRTGAIHRIPYSAPPLYRLSVPATGLDFGVVPVNAKQSLVVAIVNPLTTPVQIDTLRLAINTQSFSIVSTKPTISHDPGNRTQILPGDSLLVTIQTAPTIANQIYGDTLIVKFGCALVAIPLRAETAQPCIMMSNLDFGTLAPGQSKSLPLTICNRGGGRITFQDPWLTWLQKEFVVSASELDRLKNAKLGRDTCITITVTFVAGGKGAYRSVARFWANTRDCRDTSIWTANVAQPGLEISGQDWGGVRVTRNNPCTKNTQEYFFRDIIVTNSANQQAVVGKIELVGGDADRGFFKLDSTSPATTIQVGDVIKPGETQHVQRIALSASEEREYSCTVRVISEGPQPDTVEAIIRATAGDPHVRVTDYDFGLYQFVAPGDPLLTGRALIISRGPVPVSISAVTLASVPDFSLNSVRRTDGTPASFPETLNPGDSLYVYLRFHPQTADPVVKTAELVVEGDFSRCDDSSGSVRAGLPPAGVAVTGNSRSGVLAMRIEPNPVTNEAAIAVVLPARARTTAEIFDASGARVATLIDGMLDAGQQVLRWNTAGAPSGVYFCRVTSGALATSRSIVVTR